MNNADADIVGVIPHSCPSIIDCDIQAVTDVLESGMISEGQKTSEMELEVASRNACAASVATSSGKDALILALLAIGVTGRGVAVTTYTCREVADAIRFAGATPILVDVNEHYRMCPESVSRAILNSANAVAAIIAIHPFGLAEDIANLNSFGVPIIEDCCHAFGAQKNNQHLGSFGLCSVYSFHATKLLTAAEGGAVASTDLDFIQRLRELKYGGRTLGTGIKRFPSPLSNINSSLLLSQLCRYDRFIERRKSISNRYRSDLSEYFKFIERDTDIIFREPMRHERAEEILVKLSADGVIARRPVAPPLHHQMYTNQSFPIADKLYENTISLPLYPSLKDHEVERVIEATLDAVMR